MKKLLILLFLTLSVGCFSQTELELEKCHAYIAEGLYQECFSCYDQLIFDYGSSEGLC